MSKSCAPAHFAPRPPRDLSVHWGVQDSCLVLWLRALEPAGAPVNLGMKFALAIGTARRLEHDEAEQVFVYTYPEGAGEAPNTTTTSSSSNPGGSNNNNSSGSGTASTESSGPGKEGGSGTSHPPTATSKENNNNNNSNNQRGGEVQVYVREKVRVESADPSLLSLSAKLTALTNTLSLARANLAAVMGENIEE